MSIADGSWNFNKYGERMCGAWTRRHSPCPEPIRSDMERCPKCRTPYSAYERAHPIAASSPREQEGESK